MGEPVGGRGRRPATEPALRQRQRCARRRSCARIRTSPPTGGTATKRWSKRWRSRRGNPIRRRSTPFAGKSPTPSASSPPPRARLEKDFPDYAALSNPKPLKVEDVQKLLGADEALVLPADRRQGELCLRRDAPTASTGARSRPAETTSPPRSTAFRRGPGRSTPCKQFDLEACERALYPAPRSGRCAGQGQGTSAGGRRRGR